MVLHLSFQCLWNGRHTTILSRNERGDWTANKAVATFFLLLKFLRQSTIPALHTLSNWNSKQWKSSSINKSSTRNQLTLLQGCVLEKRFAELGEVRKAWRLAQQLDAGLGSGLWQPTGKTLTVHIVQRCVQNILRQVGQQGGIAAPLHLREHQPQYHRMHVELQHMTHGQARASFRNSKASYDSGHLFISCNHLCCIQGCRLQNPISFAVAWLGLKLLLLLPLLPTPLATCKQLL